MTGKSRYEIVIGLEVHAQLLVEPDRRGVVHGGGLGDSRARFSPCLAKQTNQVSLVAHQAGYGQRQLLASALVVKCDKRLNQHRGGIGRFKVAKR